MKFYTAITLLVGIAISTIAFADNHDTSGDVVKRALEKKCISSIKKEYEFSEVNKYGVTNSRLVDMAIGPVGGLPPIPRFGNNTVFKYSLYLKTIVDKKVDINGPFEVFCVIDRSGKVIGVEQ